MIFAKQVNVNGKSVMHSCTNHPCQCTQDVIPLLEFPFWDLLSGADYIKAVMPRDWTLHCINSVVEIAEQVSLRDGLKRDQAIVEQLLPAASGLPKTKVCLSAYCLIYKDADITQWRSPHTFDDTPKLRGPLSINGRQVREARVIVTGMPESTKVVRLLLNRRLGEWERFYNMDGTSRPKRK